MNNLTLLNQYLNSRFFSLNNLQPLRLIYFNGKGLNGEKCGKEMSHTGCSKPLVVRLMQCTKVRTAR